MKRQDTKQQRIARNIILRKTYPLFFWQECLKCRGEFRRESMWVFCYTPILTPFLQLRKICTSCAPSENEAVAIARDHIDKINKLDTWRHRRPVKPPKKASEKPLTIKDISDHIEKEVVSCLERNKGVKIDHLGRTKTACVQVWGRVVNTHDIIQPHGIDIPANTAAIITKDNGALLTVQILEGEHEGKSTYYDKDFISAAPECSPPRKP